MAKNSTTTATPTRASHFTITRNGCRGWKLSTGKATGRLSTLDQIQILPHALRREIIRDHADVIVRPEDQEEQLVGPKNVRNVREERVKVRVDLCLPFLHQVVRQRRDLVTPVVKYDQMKQRLAQIVVD